MLLVLQTSLRVRGFKKVTLAGLKIEDILAANNFVLRLVCGIRLVSLSVQRLRLAQLRVLYQALHSLLNLFRLLAQLLLQDAGEIALRGYQRHVFLRLVRGGGGLLHLGKYLLLDEGYALLQGLFYRGKAVCVFLFVKHEVDASPELLELLAHLGEVSLELADALALLGDLLLHVCQYVRSSAVGGGSGAEQ